MPVNDFLSFAGGASANVITQGAWSALAARPNGFVAGVAASDQCNKVWRQSTSMAAALGQFIADYGALDALDDGNIANLVRDFARSVQAGKFGFVVATGTANAWVLTPTPAIAAYAAGRPLWIKAPATNTATTVTAAVSGLAARPIKKRNGADPAIGDLVANVWYPTIDDGASIIVVTALASDINEAIRATPVYGLVAEPAATFSVPDNVLTKVTAFGSVTNNLPGTTLVNGDLTIGLSGYYDCSFYLGTNYASQTGSFSFIGSINVGAVSKIGNSGSSVNSAAIALGAFFSGAGMLRLTAGNVLSLQQKHNSGVTQNGPMGLSVVFRGA